MKKFAHWTIRYKLLSLPLPLSVMTFAVTGTIAHPLRQKGLHIRWRDMARSNESIRQLFHHKGLDDYPQVR